MKLFTLVSAVAANSNNGAWIGDTGSYQALVAEKAEFIVRNNMDCGANDISGNPRLNIADQDACARTCVNHGATCKGYVYSASQKKCWIKKGCPKANYDAGISYSASPPAANPWIANLVYGARLDKQWVIDNNFRRTLVDSCNNGQLVEIGAVLINPVGGVPSGFTPSFDGALGSTASFGSSVATKSFDTNNNLVLTQMVGTAGCPTAVVDGVTVCIDTAENYTFKCKYSLADKTVSDNYQVTGQDTEALAEGTGSLGYTLEVSDNNEIGGTVTFTVTPDNADLVYATVKSCDVGHGGQSVTIIGHGLDQNGDANDKCVMSEVGAQATTAFFSSQQNIVGTWTAFKWSTSKSSNDAEAQTLTCTIGLSQNQNTEAINNCINS